LITRRVDEESGIIYVTSVGIPTFAALDEHYDALRTLIAPFRNAGRRVLLLSDIRRSARTTSELEQHILGQMARTFEPGDRIVLLTDGDDKSYIRHVLKDVAIAAFSSQLAAEIWLVTDDLSKIG
jgi:hypothetical protein